MKSRYHFSLSDEAMAILNSIRKSTGYSRSDILEQLLFQKARELNLNTEQQEKGHASAQECELENHGGTIKEMIQSALEEFFQRDTNTGSDVQRMIRGTNASVHAIEENVAILLEMANCSELDLSQSEFYSIEELPSNVYLESQRVVKERFAANRQKRLSKNKK